MHFFLTGARQIGKSTIIAKALAEYSGALGGFATVLATGLDFGVRTLLFHPADMPRCEEESRVIAHFENGRMVADTERFNRLGTECLARAQNAKLVLMDECGYLEREALAFQQAVFETLDRSVPVLGVVRLGGGAFTNAIERHPHVCTHTVTLENRDALTLLAARWIKEAFT